MTSTSSSTDSLVTLKPVLVTGANGFIASHVVQQLLEKGYTVYGTVRSLKDEKRYNHLKELNGAAERLKLFEAGLTKEGSFDEAVKDCEYILHTASPYVVDVKDVQKDLVEPAIQGTLNVLKSCIKVGNGTVKRVVVTSSVAAITDSPDNNKKYTEKDWNTESSPSRNPYYYSKVQAEKAAWEFVKKNNAPFELVVLNPCVVLGPSLNKEEINTSNKLFAGMFKGEYPGIVNLGWAIVDVRDVARAHLLAMSSKDIQFNYDSEASISSRYVIASGTKLMSEVVEILGKNFPKLKSKLPTMNLQSSVGNLLMQAASLFVAKGTGSYIRTNIGRYTYLDNTKSQKELGMTYMSIEQTLIDTINDLLKLGHLSEK